jgi:hypothetical protein
LLPPGPAPKPAFGHHPSDLTSIPFRADLCQLNLGRQKPVKPLFFIALCQQKHNAMPLRKHIRTSENEAVFRASRRHNLSLFMASSSREAATKSASRSPSRHF